MWFYWPSLFFFIFVSPSPSHPALLPLTSSDIAVSGNFISCQRAIINGTAQCCACSQRCLVGQVSTFAGESAILKETSVEVLCCGIAVFRDVWKMHTEPFFFFSIKKFTNWVSLDQNGTLCMCVLVFLFLIVSSNLFPPQLSSLYRSIYLSHPFALVVLFPRPATTRQVRVAVLSTIQTAGWCPKHCTEVRFVP